MCGYLHASTLIYKLIPCLKSWAADLSNDIKSFYMYLSFYNTILLSVTVRRISIRQLLDGLWLRTRLVQCRFYQEFMRIYFVLRSFEVTSHMKVPKKCSFAEWLHYFEWGLSCSFYWLWQTIMEGTYVRFRRLTKYMAYAMVWQFGRRESIGFSCPITI